MIGMASVHRPIYASGTANRETKTEVALKYLSNINLHQNCSALDGVRE